MSPPVAASPGAADFRPRIPLGLLAFSAAMTITVTVLASTYIPYHILKWSASTLEWHVGRTFLAPAMMVLAAAAFFCGMRWFVFLALTLRAAWLYERRPVPHIREWPLVSILVPAFNEEETIGPAIESLIGLDYPRMQVIVVDDGSRDRTFEKAKRYEGRHGHCTVEVHHKPNGGKWSALNLAFARSTGELCLCVDADSKLGPQSIRLMVERLADPEIDVVAGHIRVRNRISLLTRLQALEYLLGSGALRLAQSHSGCVLVVPGPLGLYRRSVMEEVFLRWGAHADAAVPGHADGPLEGDTFAEDFDLSLAVLSLGGRIVYEPYAVSHTKAPQTVSALISQRYRWWRGTLQVLRKYVRRSHEYRGMLRPRLVVWLLATYGADMFFLPFAYAIGVMTILVSLLSGGGLFNLMIGAAPIVLLSGNAAAFCIALHGDRLSLLPVVLVYDFYHGFMLNSAWLIAVIDEVRGTRMRWS